MRNESRPQDQTITPKPPAEAGDEPGVYVHEPAGIRERSGSVPAWLMLIALGLILWGLYYTIRFWSSN